MMNHKVIYTSTREKTQSNQQIGLEQLLLQGIAPDGGLYVASPLHQGQQPLPSIETLLAKLNVHSAQQVTIPTLVVGLLHYFLHPFVDKHPEVCGMESLKGVVERAFAQFTHPDIVPIRKILSSHEPSRQYSHADGNGDEGRLFLLETFHGPSLSFKDLALQVLSELFSSYLDSRKVDQSTVKDTPQSQLPVILTATSGDTGAAAVSAFANRHGIKLMILHPHGGISGVQRQQMTTSNADNVKNIAVRGTFDDCQALVKRIMNKYIQRHDSPQTLSVSDSTVPPVLAVNSINWIRVVVQMSYYFKAALTLGVPIDVFVPTGNFGNVLAAHYVQSWLNRAPVSESFTGNNATPPTIASITAACNSNCAVECLLTGKDLLQGKASKTLAPAMDIVVPSNFERYVSADLSPHESWGQVQAYLYTVNSTSKSESDSNDDTVSALEREPTSDVSATSGRPSYAMKASVCSDETITTTMRDFHSRYGVVVDPHTATALWAWKQQSAQQESGIESSARGHHAAVVVSTAHPAKFPQAVFDAIGHAPFSPPAIEALASKQENYTILHCDEVDEAFADFARFS